jgi:phosphomannomutase
MKLPSLEPLVLSSSNPGKVEEYDFNIRLAKKTGTNGPRDLFSAYSVDFFEQYAAAFAETVGTDLVIGFDGSRFHQSISTSAREYLRRLGITIFELDGPVTVPEFMFACSKLGYPGCFFGRSHSPQQYVGLKLVINARNVFTLLEKMKAKITCPKKFKAEELYGFLPRTLAPVVEDAFKERTMIHPQKIGKAEKVPTGDLREAFVKSLKKVTPMTKIDGEFIIDCRHSMAGRVWELIEEETNATFILDNNALNPVAPDRDPREIWDQLIEQYHSQPQAVFDHDADADRTFLVKKPGIGKDKIVHNQEESFTTGLLAEALERKAEAYILVQERISLIMLSSLGKLTETVYATAQGEPSFFLGATELLTNNPSLSCISGADYTDIFVNRSHPVCMKSPYQQALWMMFWFTKNDDLPAFPEVDVERTQIDMLALDYPQRLNKVLQATNKISDYFEEQFTTLYKSMLDGQNLMVQDKKNNTVIVSIRPSGTGRYTKVFTEIGLGQSDKKERKRIAQEINKEISKIIG